MILLSRGSGLLGFFSFICHTILSSGIQADEQCDTAQQALNKKVTLKTLLEQERGPSISVCNKPHKDQHGESESNHVELEMEDRLEKETHSFIFLQIMYKCDIFICT